jgi:hypothetical protein
MSIPMKSTFLNDAGVPYDQPGSLADICEALNAYSRRNDQGSKAVEIYIIYKEAQHWLKKMESVFQSDKKINRVKALLVEAITELENEERGLGKALVTYKKDGAHKGKAELQPGYHLERETYLANGKKTAPYSGSLVKKKVKNDNKFSSLSANEFNTIGQETTARMYFLNKIQRLRFRAEYSNKTWVNIKGKTLSTNLLTNNHIGQEHSLQMYAMDRYGNLFVDYTNDQILWQRMAVGGTTFVMADERKNLLKERGIMNHSSLCAGREVICAGTIFFWKGQLLHIDNFSGHYAPDSDALRKALTILKEEGTDLGYLRVGAKYQGDNNGFWTAQGFISKMASPDWPSQDWHEDQDKHFSGKGAQL